MKKSTLRKLTALVAVFALAMAGCSSANNASTPSSVGNTETKTVQITDIHGTVTVPVNPKRVIALDNRTFETLADWDIQLAAVPKSVMPTDSPYVQDKNVKDIGNHRDPNLELIAAIDPDLVIVGQRFANFYEDIKEIVPNATVIDLNFDVSAATDTPGENLVMGLKTSTITLGKIFDKNSEADKLIADFDMAIANGKSAYNGTDTIMSIVVSGGEIGFSAPRYGRVWGPLYDIFGWASALEVGGATSDHMGDDISVEAIAQSNPNWIFVLDRDAAVSSTTDAVPALDVINNSPALKNTTAVKDEHIIYAPNDTYTNESIQTYLELFKNIATALK